MIIHLKYFMTLVIKPIHNECVCMAGNVLRNTLDDCPGPCPFLEGTSMLSVALVFNTLEHPAASTPTLERVTKLIQAVEVVLGSPVLACTKQRGLLFFSWAPSLAQGWAHDRIRSKNIFTGFVQRGSAYLLYRIWENVKSTASATCSGLWGV